MRIAQIVESTGKKCEDRVAVFRDSERVVVVVADGAGGMGGGAEAADAAISLAKEELPSLSARPQYDELLYRMDAGVSKLSAGGQTTCVIAVITPTEILGASVGDSGAWLISDNSAEELTRFQIRKPFLGSGMASPVAFAHKLSTATLLVATDGLLKYTNPDKIRERINPSDLDSSAKSLVDLVRYPSGDLPDDIGIVLIGLNT